MGLADEREHEAERERDESAGDDRHRAGETPRAMARTAARRERHERPPRSRTRARGIVLAALYALGLVALVLLALAAHFNTLLPPDLPFTREVQEKRVPGVAGVLYFVSALGFSPLAEGIVLGVALALVLLRRRLEAIFLLVATAIADGLGALLKLAVNRQRPSPTLVHVVQRLNSPSFPSGHTLHYTVFYGFLASVLISGFRSSWPRNLSLAICLALIALVGISRVYLGEHWLTDVLGGYLLGGLFLLPLIAVYRWARARVSRVPSG